MASLVGAVTFLGLSALSGANGFVFAGTRTETTVTAYTRLGLAAAPSLVPAFLPKAAVSLQPFSVSDTAAFSATETPIDRNEVTTWDTAALRLSAETANFLIRYAVSDTATMTIAESIGLVQSGVIDRPVTDTASLSTTEAAAIAVQVSVTDDAALSGTDSGTVDVSRVALSATDDAALSTADTASVTVFTGSIGINLSDGASLTVTETASIDLPRVVTDIRIRVRAPSIVFRKV